MSFAADIVRFCKPLKCCTDRIEIRHIDEMKMIATIIKLIFLPIRFLNKLIYGSPAHTIVGYAWYTKGEYQKFLDSAKDDLDILVATYDSWKRIADKQVVEMKEKGWIVFKVQIRMDDLNAWLKKNFLINISENREKYVDYRLAKFLENAEI